MVSGRSEPRTTLWGKGCRSLARLVRVDPNTSVIKLWEKGPHPDLV